MRALERRIAKLEPPCSGATLHVIKACSDEDAEALFQELQVKPNDLCVWLKEFTDVPIPAKHLYSKPLGRGA